VWNPERKAVRRLDDRGVVVGADVLNLRRERPAGD
jgi:hypothetical protein